MYKHYTDGQILTADDANAFMRQGTIFVDSVAERDRINAEEGMRVWHRPSKALIEYVGGAWRRVDSGWVSFVDIVPDTGATLSQGPGARRIGDVVYLNGLLTANGGGNLADVAAYFSVPVEMRPNGLRVMAVTNDANRAAHGSLRVETNGVVRIGSSGLNSRMWLNCSYVL